MSGYLPDGGFADFFVWPATTSLRSKIGRSDGEVCRTNSSVKQTDSSARKCVIYEQTQIDLDASSNHSEDRL